MRLSQPVINKISSKNVALPGTDFSSLPEKVLQFGTGRLLRGLPDYFIDAANRKSVFNGRVVMVKSTSKGSVDAFVQQDNLYTLCERGYRNGKPIQSNTIISAVSRVLVAQNQWKKILACAHNSDMTIVVSNTTESGLRLAQDDIHRHPPESFPGKLLAFLYERYKAFNGREGTGMVIIPTELIPDNGKLLASIVMELARMNGLDEKFMEWLGKENTFCNSLVDRIVTGMPAPGEKEKIENSIGYQDDLMIVSEPYCLWAVEGDEKVKQVLSFVNGAKGIIVEENIDKYRELKLRLLNGTHTLTCGIAFLSHCNTVADAMHDEWLNAYIRNVMNGEIAPAIPYPIPALQKTEFANEVRERFGNPNLQHLWKNITLQYSSKMRFRCIPLLLNYFKIKQQLPKLLVLGFAAYLFYTKPLRQSGKLFYGELDGEAYLIEDDAAGWFLEAWKEPSTENFVKQVLQNTMLWGQDISILPSLQNEVVKYLNAIKKYGMKATLAKELGSAVN